MKETVKEKHSNSWQENFLFALGNYYWKSPSGKRLCVVREFAPWSEAAIEKYGALEFESRFEKTEADFWCDQLSLLKKQKYPQDILSANEQFAKEVSEKIWEQKDDKHLIHFYLACWQHLEFESKLSALRESDFDLYILFSFRAAALLLTEIVFNSHSYQAALNIAHDYLEHVQKLSNESLDYELASEIKSNGDAPDGSGPSLFKKLNRPQLGAWNELLRSDIFRYMINTFSPPWQYPSGSVSFRLLLIQALEESGLPGARDFIHSFEIEWAKREEHVA